MSTQKPIERGLSVIKAEVEKLPNTPGVYRMLNEKGDALYVGKAKALKKRVASYTHFKKLSIRLQRMVAQTRSMEFVHTASEVEALLLESNLIKKLKPTYNILLRDDKSFPYILLTDDHDFPQVTKHRGAKKRKGEYFGPFASAGNVNRTIHLLQRVFMLRNCTDHVFANRSRPCLQYHIKRCTAPCVGYVSKDDYAEQMDEARQYLCGKSRQLQDRFAKKMQKASEGQDYEEAAKYRDRIKALTAIQSAQDINVTGLKNADVMALHQESGQSCIQVFFFRGGQNYGNWPYFPRHIEGEEPEKIMAAFLAQFYERKPIPHEVYVNIMPEQQALIEEALSSRSKTKFKICKPSRGAKKRVLEFAEKNAKAALERYKIEKASEAKLLEGVAALFDLDETPRRIEVYDNSHISGTNMVGAMIVAGPEGFQKSSYRKFNIKEADAADDYGMMREVLERRFKRVLLSASSRSEISSSPELAPVLRSFSEAGKPIVRGSGEGNNQIPAQGGDDKSYTSAEDWPDILLIDGGQGQYNTAKAVLEEYGIMEDLLLVAIAKGEDRDAGRETFFVAGKKPFQRLLNDPVLHYLQRLRDEAHRFAIGSHRTRRKMDIRKSPLDQIPGVGGHRKRALLNHFGSAKAVANASLEDLLKVNGLSKSLAQKIYDWFR